MSWPLQILLVALAAGPGADPSSGPAPSDQTLLFYNARLALREDRPTEVLKLWLVRNALAAEGRVSPHDEDFRSVVWAALGDLGLCQDGYPQDDEGGAGLWPLALHNWVALSAARGPAPDQQAPFEAFEVGRQRRFISLNDVLSLPELRSATFFRTSCFLPWRLTATDFRGPAYDLTDRLFVALLLRKLLLSSLETLTADKIESVAPIEARLFDLQLAVANLRARQARREALTLKQRARGLGVSEQGARELQQAATKWPPGSEQALFLQKSLGWKPSAWLALTRPRRLFLFAQAKPLSENPPALEGLILGLVDALTERRQGDELASWLGFLDAADEPARRRAVTEGDRGKRLLELGPETGFRERSAIALHRGVAFLERGERQEALRSFAFAMAHAEESREPEVSLALGRRWLSFVLSRYETDAEVIATLKRMVPPQEYNAVIEDLVWKAALRADQASFERVVASARRGGAFDTRAERLRPLSQGKAGELLTLLRDAFEEEPNLTLRFVQSLLERVETEEADVRAANASMLRQLGELVDTFAATAEAKAHARKAEGLGARIQAILEGLGHLELSLEGRARTLSPGYEAFAGNVRLAPADPLPWPFKAPEVEAPSPFGPLVLEPVEWRDAKGQLVFGWRISE